MESKKELYKLEKKLGEEASRFRGMSKTELDFELLKLTKHLQDITSTQQMDEEYQKAKEVLKELGAPYSEQRGQAKLRSRFIHLLLKENE
jgi:hypothetical protein